MIEIHLILLFMIVGAVIAVEAKDLLSSVVAVGAVGLGLSLAFLILKAPDLAITQLVVEILCLIILIRATIKRDLPLIRNGRWHFNTISTLLFIAVFLGLAYVALKDLPVFGQPILRVASNYLKEGLIKTGAVNLVSSVILDFRAYDTLGEATVLFTAVIGVLAVMRKVGRKKVSMEDKKSGMTLIVKTITRLTVGLILLYGIYIVLHGHLSPGGGFPGGVIIALSFIHLMLAFGKDTALRKLNELRASFLESLGAIMFLGVALLGLLGGYFFLNFINKGEPFSLFSAGIIPVCNIAICFKVGAGLFAIFIALVILQKTDEEE